MFPIRDENGRILVDGGVVAPMPVDAVREMGADIVIGIDLLSCGVIFHHAPRTAFGMLIKGAMTLLRAASNNQNYVADAVIMPEIAHIRPDEIRRGRELMELGERAARDKIDEIKRLIAR